MTGRVVAIVHLVPVGTPDALERLIAEGRVTPADQPNRPAGRRVVTVGTVSDQVGEQPR